MFSHVFCRTIKHLGFCYCLLDFIVFSHVNKSLMALFCAISLLLTVFAFLIPSFFFPSYFYPTFCCCAFSASFSTGRTLSLYFHPFLDSHFEFESQVERSILLNFPTVFMSSLLRNNSVKYNFGTVKVRESTNHCCLWDHGSCPHPQLNKP